MKTYARRETLRDRILRVLNEYPEEWFDTTPLAKEVWELGEAN